jgi:hypothetical protein
MAKDFATALFAPKNIPAETIKAPLIISFKKSLLDLFSES